MPRELVDRIDDFRVAHRLKSRAEAIRRLIEDALEHQPDPPQPTSPRDPN